MTENTKPAAPVAVSEARGAIPLRDGVSVPGTDLETRFVRSSGPGGQNVNKVATKVELRFKLGETRCLTEPRKRRLAATFPSHVTLQGDFVVTCDSSRSQLMNLRDARNRLREMILRIWVPPRPRKKTKPSKASQRRRVLTKRQRGERKRERSSRDFD